MYMYIPYILVNNIIKNSKKILEETKIKKIPNNQGGTN